MKYPNYNGVEYKPNNKAIPIEVKCPLIDNWINLVDCMENRGTADEYIPDRFKRKKDWRHICDSCPFCGY